MTDFWLLSVLLLALGVLAVIWPLWTHRQQIAVDRTALNVALYEERLAELDTQLAAGDLTAAQREAASEEASRLLLEDTAQADGRQDQKKRGGPWMLILSAGLLPVVVVALYMSWGNPEGLALYRELQENPEPESLEALIDRMERITQVQPENGEAWYMLGRGYMSAQQPDKAVQAYGNSLERLGERPEVLAQLAQARFFAAGNQLDAESVAALNKALELDPNEPTALGLLGVAAFEAGEYSGAIRYWERLMADMSPDSVGAQAIQGGIDRARQRMGISTVTAEQDAATGAPAEQTEQEVAAGGPAVIRVRLELSEEVRAEVDENAIIFLFARDPAGPPMPLVARRFSLSDLPAEVVLSSSDAMLPNVTLKTGQAVQLTARVSPTGDAMQGSHQEVIDNVEVGAEEPVLLRVESRIN